MLDMSTGTESLGFKLFTAIVVTIVIGLMIATLPWPSQVEAQTKTPVSKLQWTDQIDNRNSPLKSVLQQSQR